MLQLQDGATDGRRPGGGPVGPSINFATAWQQQSNQTPALLPHGPAFDGVVDSKHPDAAGPH